MKSLLSLIKNDNYILLYESKDLINKLPNINNIATPKKGSMYIYGMLVNEPAKVITFDNNFNNLCNLTSTILNNAQIDTEKYVSWNYNFIHILDNLIKPYFAGTSKGKYKLDMDFENPGLYAALNINTLGKYKVNVSSSILGLLMLLNVKGPVPYKKNTVKFDGNNAFLYIFSVFYQIDNVDFICDNDSAKALRLWAMTNYELAEPVNDYENGDELGPYRNTCKNLNIYVKPGIGKDIHLPDRLGNILFVHRGAIDNLVVHFEDKSYMNHKDRPWNLGFSSGMIKNIKYVCEEGLNISLAFSEDARYSIMGSNWERVYDNTEISFIGKTFYDKNAADLSSSKVEEWHKSWLKPINKLTLDYRLVSSQTGLGLFDWELFSYDEINIVNADINYDHTKLAAEIGLKNPDKYKYNIYDVLKSVFKHYPGVKVNADDPKVLEKLKAMQKKALPLTKKMLKQRIKDYGEDVKSQRIFQNIEL